MSKIIKKVLLLYRSEKKMCLGAKITVEDYYYYNV